MMTIQAIVHTNGHNIKITPTQAAMTAAPWNELLEVIISGDAQADNVDLMIRRIDDGRGMIVRYETRTMITFLEAALDQLRGPTLLGERLEGVPSPHVWEALIGQPKKTRTQRAREALNSLLGKALGDSPNVTETKPGPHVHKENRR